MKIVSTLLAATTLSLPLISVGCNRIEEKSQAVKPNEVKPEIKLADIKPLNIKSKEVLDKERQELTKQEVKFTNVLLEWNHNLNYILFYIPISVPLPEEEVKLNKAFSKAVDSRQDFNRKGNLTPKGEIAENFIPKGEIPNKELIELFIGVLKATNEGASFIEPYLKLTAEEFATKMEKGFKDTLQEQDVQDLVEAVTRHLPKYKKSLEDVRQEMPKFIQAMEKFNIDAKSVGQPPYEPKWGLGLDELRALKSIR